MLAITNGFSVLTELTGVLKLETVSQCETLPSLDVGTILTDSNNNLE